MSMEHDNYMSRLCELLCEAGVPERIRVDREAFKAYPSGADFNGLMQILPQRWIVSEPVPDIGYKGITVHWELERPGYLVLHCEPYPRIGKKKDHHPDSVAGLRTLKDRITQKLRKAFVQVPQVTQVFDLDRIRRSDDFSGNKVLGFDLGLPQSHRPEEAIPVLENLLTYYTSVIDASMAEILSDKLRHLR